MPLAQCRSCCHWPGNTKFQSSLIRAENLQPRQFHWPIWTCGIQLYKIDAVLNVLSEFTLRRLQNVMKVFGIAATSAKKSLLCWVLMLSPVLQTFKRLHGATNCGHGLFNQCATKQWHCTTPSTRQIWQFLHRKIAASIKCRSTSWANGIFVKLQCTRKKDQKTRWAREPTSKTAHSTPFLRNLVVWAATLCTKPTQDLSWDTVPEFTTACCLSYV